MERICAWKQRKTRGHWPEGQRTVVASTQIFLEEHAIIQEQTHQRNKKSSKSTKSQNI